MKCNFFSKQNTILIEMGGHVIYTYCISENICTASAIKPVNLDLDCYNVKNCIPPTHTFWKFGVEKVGIARALRTGVSE